MNKIIHKYLLQWWLPVCAAGIVLLSLAQPTSGRAAVITDAAAVQPNPNVQPTVQPGNLQESKVEVALLRILAKGSSDFEIVMAEQADLSAAYSMDWQARGQYVYDTLSQTAARSQKNAIAYLKSKGFKYQSFINGNEIYVFSGNLAAATTLAAMPNVSEVHAPVNIQLDGPGLKPVGPDPALAAGTVDWGITDTKADQFWSAFKKTGQGVVVANIDTGVQYDHPALANAYKCKNSANIADPSCWLDALSVCSANAPCDNAGHGTHTMGTMVGSNDATLQHIVGMAPGAQWIACKACATATDKNSCTSLALNTCADWLLAPGGDTNNRPDVVNNSWGGGSGDSWYQGKVQAWQAAGIFPAFAAGNTVPTASCSSVSDPGDYPESFASAAHDSSRTHALFSNMGPSLFGDTPYTKPNISAPGVAICSSVPGSGWDCTPSGTSMASPHSAGAAALLLSCNPGLKGQVDQIFRLLQNNADAAPVGSCGAPAGGKGNYTFGYGYLDVLAAGNAACVVGTLTGTVTSGQTAAANAIVTVTSTALPGFTGKTTTDANGVYTIGLAAATYHVSVDSNGYVASEADGVVVSINQVATQNFSLDPAPPVTVTGQVKDASGHGYPLYARIDITDADFSGSVFTNPLDGTYQVSLYQDTKYDFVIKAVLPGYLDGNATGMVFSNSDATQDFSLQVDSESCTAPGYVKTIALSENFDSVTPPDLPANWSVVTTTGKTANWATETTSVNPPGAPYSSPNQVFFNSYAANSGESARLEYNLPFDMTTLAMQTVSFWMYHDNSFPPPTYNDRVQVQVSTNGTVWVNVGASIIRYSTTNHWEKHTIDLSDYATATSLWIGLNGISGWGTNINIDNIEVGADCATLPGGLVEGFVSDAVTHAGLEGAMVTSDSASTTSLATQDDANIPDGLYMLFQTPAGDRSFSASYKSAGYGSDTHIVTVITDALTQQDFALPVGFKFWLPLIIRAQ